MSEASLFDFVEKIFHAQAVDDKNVSRLQRAHVFGRELIIVQATCLRRRQVDDFNALDAASDVERVEVNRIERRDDFERVLVFVGTATRQRERHHNQCETKNFFHEIILSKARTQIGKIDVHDGILIVGVGDGDTFGRVKIFRAI